MPQQDPDPRREMGAVPHVYDRTWRLCMHLDLVVGDPPETTTVVTCDYGHAAEFRPDGTVWTRIWPYQDRHQTTAPAI